MRFICMLTRMMWLFHNVIVYEVLVLVMTGQALLMSLKGRNASRDGLVKLWEGGFYYYYIVK